MNFHAHEFCSFHTDHGYTKGNKAVKTYRFVYQDSILQTVHTDVEFKSGSYIMLDDHNSIYCITGVREVFDLLGNVVGNVVNLSRIAR